VIDVAARLRKRLSRTSSDSPTMLESMPEAMLERLPGLGDCAARKAEDWRGGTGP